MYPENFYEKVDRSNDERIEQKISTVSTDVCGNIAWLKYVVHKDLKSNHDI